MTQQTNVAVYPQKIVVVPSTQKVVVLGATGPVGPAGVVSNFDSIPDVNLTGLLDNQGITFDLATEMWIPTTLSTLITERALYTPTLRDITLGAGGTNECTYTYIGDAVKGLLHLDGRIILGTSASVGPGDPGIELPTGFTFGNFSSTNILFPSVAKYSTGGLGGSIGCMRYKATAPAYVNFIITTVSATYPTLTSLSATIPFIWASGATFYYQAVVGVNKI